jgi:hypothetical protein
MFLGSDNHMTTEIQNTGNINLGFIYIINAIFSPHSDVLQMVNRRKCWYKCTQVPLFLLLLYVITTRQNSGMYLLLTIFLNLELLLRVTYTGRYGVSMVTAHDAHEHRSELPNHDHTRVNPEQWFVFTFLRRASPEQGNHGSNTVGPLKDPIIIIL